MSKDSSGIPEWPQFSSELMRQGPAIRKAHMTSLVRYLKEKHGLKTVNILEVGSWAGASTITWARAIKDLGLSGSVHCVDIWEPYFDLEANTDETYEKMNRAATHGVIFQEFRRNIAAAGVDDIVTVTKGNSRDVLPELMDASYEIVFVDGSHLYPDIYQDIVQAKRLAADGGIVCGDDYELAADAVDPTFHRQKLSNNVDFTEDPSSGIGYHPGVSQAIADAFDEVSVWDGLWAVRRTGTSFEPIDRLDYEPQIPEHLRAAAQTTLAEVVRSELGFNIIRSQGSFIACRESLGEVDFSLPLNLLTQSHASSDLFVATSVENALIGLCDLKINELRPNKQEAPLVELVESQLGFNIIRSQGSFIACRQSLGDIDFSLPLDSLTQSHTCSDLFVAATLEDALLQICDLTKRELRSNMEADPVIEFVDSQLGFNIIRSQGRYVACRQSLGVIDFLLPLKTLTQSHASSDLFIAATLEDVLLQLCDLTIRELSSNIQQDPAVELVEAQLGFNIVKNRGNYIACRQTLGPVDFTRSLRSLSQTYSADDLFFASTRERVLLRICEIEKAALSHLVAERFDREAITVAEPTN